MVGTQILVRGNLRYHPKLLVFSLIIFSICACKDDKDGITEPSNQEPSLSSSSVSPTSGTTTTTFNYSVKYTDPDDDKPASNFLYIDGTSSSMIKKSGTFSSGASYEFSTSALSAGGHNYYFSFDDGQGHSVRLPGSGTYSGPTVTEPTPNPPILVSPSNGATGVSTDPTLNWNASSGATSYILQVHDNSSFTSPVHEETGITSTQRQISGLSNNTTYYWRISASNSSGTSAWSSTWNFTTESAGSAPDPPTLLSPSDGTTGISTS